MKIKKIIMILVSVVLVLGLLIAGYFMYKKNWVKSVNNYIDANQNGLPGQLLGPITSFKAKNLDPNEVLKWTNQYRAENNLPALKMNDLLTQAAQKKTNDMFTKQYFEHVSPDGTTPAQVVTSTGYKYAVTGENLALGDFQNEKDLVEAWMASPGHRENILNTNYTEIGIAAGLNSFEDRGKTWLAVQEFGRPSPNCNKPSEQTLSDINNKKAQYESLKSQVTALSAEASNLNNQANEKIQKGNDIYTQTSDKAQAQPYWDEGTALRAQADAKILEAKNLQTQGETLQKEIENSSNTYNTQVNTYNTCISH